MIAYKGFNKDLTCTLGNGTFQYEEGKTYKEKEANCAKNGFHCAENPMDCLSWYPNYEENAYYVVHAAGDIDDIEDRISCTEMKLERKLDVIDFLECVASYYMEYPKRAFIERSFGWMQCALGDYKATKEAKAVLVRGKNPKVCAPAGCYICVLIEEKDSKEIVKCRIGVSGGTECE